MKELIWLTAERDLVFRSPPRFCYDPSNVLIWLFQIPAVMGFLGAYTFWFVAKVGDYVPICFYRGSNSVYRVVNRIDDGDRTPRCPR